MAPVALYSCSPQVCSQASFRPSPSPSNSAQRIAAAAWARNCGLSQVSGPMAEGRIEHAAGAVLARPGQREIGRLELRERRRQGRRASGRRCRRVEVHQHVEVAARERDARVHGRSAEQVELLGERERVAEALHRDVVRILDADRARQVLAAVVEEAGADEVAVLRPRVEAVGGAVEGDEALAAGDERQERGPQRMVGRQIAAREEDERMVRGERRGVEPGGIGAQVHGERAAARLRHRGHRGACVHPGRVVVCGRVDVVQIQDAPLRRRRRGERQADDGEHEHTDGDRTDVHAY